MHTILFIISGLLGYAVILGLCFMLDGKKNFISYGSKLFIPLWLVASLSNMYVGVVSAGYSIFEELPIFLVTFCFPTFIVALTWKTASTHNFPKF